MHSIENRFVLTVSLPCCHLKTTNKSATFETLIVSVFFFALACERIFIKTHSIKSRCYRSEKYTVCMHVRVSFSPEI